MGGAESDEAGKRAADVVATGSLPELEEALGRVLLMGSDAVSAFARAFGPRKLLKRLSRDPELSDSPIADEVLNACTRLAEGSSSSAACSGLCFSQDFAEVLHRDELYPDEEVTLRRPLCQIDVDESTARTPLKLGRLRAGRAAFVPSACVCIMEHGSPHDPADTVIRITSSSRRMRLGSEIECKVWPAAVMLARWLWCHSFLLTGASVLEIGAGVGLAGLAAARCGASEVVLTDINRTALQLARENVAKSEAASANVGVCHLDWSSPPILDSDVADSEGEEAPAVLRRLRSPFDVILAADVVNAEGLSELVVRMIHAYLAADGLFLMICPLSRHRYMVDELRRLLLADAALEVSVSHVPGWLSVDVEEADVVAHELFVVQRMRRTDEP